MEETLGKRIARQRKQMGLTQDALAEQLGVTAQAVSKWENDQSCPDIAMLPKLAQIFSITTDEMLGLKQPPLRTTEVVTEPEENEPEGIHLSNGSFEMKFNTGTKGSLGLALWILLSGGLLLAYPLWFAESVSLWDVLWPAGLFVFGLFGLYPKLSVFRLGCGLLGGYYLLINLHVIPPFLTRTYLLPLFLVLFGLSLLTEALGRPNSRSRFHCAVPSGVTRKNYCNLDGGHFSCGTSFGENTYPIRLPTLTGGQADLSFGSMTIDLRECAQVSSGCTLDLNAAFGALTVLVPRRYRIEQDSSTAFAAVEIEGSPGAEISGIIRVHCSVSFGEITLRYV